MKHLARSLYYWLAASTIEQTPSSSSHVLSCSDTTIQLMGDQSALQVGQVFVHVGDAASDSLCRDDCGVLFREIVSDDLGDGLYRTQPATFAQVFPVETFDAEYADVSIESILPSCGEAEDQDSAVVSRVSRRLQEADSDATETVTVTNLTTVTVTDVNGTNYVIDIARKYDDDDYEHYDDDDYEHYDDDYYVEKKGEFELFCDATKTFIYDLYCIIRNLDCTPYDPDINEDDHYEDDDHTGSSKSKDERVVRRRMVRGVKGRRLQVDTTTDDLPTDSTTVNLPTEVDFGTESTTTTTTTTDDLPTDSTTVNLPTEVDFGTDSTTTTTSEASSASAEDKTGDSKDDGGEHPYDDDDFFDDDDNFTEDEGNFWKILDAFLGYFESLYCIFRSCPEVHPSDDDYHPTDDKYSSDDEKDKHMRLLQILEPATVYVEQTSFWLTQVLYGENEMDTLLQQVPSTMEEWLLLKEDGDCQYTKCSGATTPSQCFEGQHLVGDSCRASMNQWFALPSTAGEDNVLSWELDMACYGQDYCYASNIFEQTVCDAQFYKSLLQACPSSYGSSHMALSSEAPLTTADLYDHCSLVSVLLYAQAQQQSQTSYHMTQENQSVFESNNCH